MSSPSATAPWSSKRVRREFLRLEGAIYGYGQADALFSAKIAREYPNLRNVVYLDYSASPPAPVSTFHAFTRDVSTTLYSNPHSRSPSSTAATAAISNVRRRVMSDVFGLATPQAQAKWDVVFTSGATGALKLVAESYDWTDRSDGNGGVTYRYVTEVHTSVLGIRGTALERGGAAQAMTLEEVATWLSDGKAGARDLFAYPAQCNATGKRLGLELCRKIKQRHPACAVLLDAAAYLASTPLDLDSIPTEEAPDFVACSFYKLYGYPTGLGCLLVKKDAFDRIAFRPYFGGGTITGVSVSTPFWNYSQIPGAHEEPRIHEALEDGTVSFLGIVALGHAMDTFRRLYGSQSAVSAHACALASLMRRELDAVRHPNGRKAVQLHEAFKSGRTSAIPLAPDGPVISFTAFNAESEMIGHVSFDRAATADGFQLRSGGLCNAGAMDSVLGLTDEERLQLYLAGNICGGEDNFAFSNNSMKALGIVRISLGAASTVDDVLKFIEFFRKEGTLSFSEPTVGGNASSNSFNPTGAFP
ncbi:Molybdenum cofactor sulfurase [Pseudohyphozyma bogoriensis]|nr:Molybdenum cofactor sulfurase [Pseudohyphozyma bogoriensis]